MTDPMSEPPVSDEELAQWIGRNPPLGQSAGHGEGVIVNSKKLLSIITELQQRRRPTPEPTQEEVERVSKLSPALLNKICGMLASEGVWRDVDSLRAALSSMNRRDADQ